MPIAVACSCGRQIQAKDELAGKTVKCPGCGQPLRIQAAAPVQFAAAPQMDPLGGFGQAGFGGMPGGDPLGGLGGMPGGGFGAPGMGAGFGGQMLGGPGMGMPDMSGGMGMPGGGMPGMGMPGMAGMGGGGWQTAPREKGASKLVLGLVIGLGGFVILLMLGLVIGMSLMGDDEPVVAANTAGTGTSTPAAGTPAAGTPAAGTPAAGTPAAGTPAAGTPAAGTPAAGTPAAGTPAAGTPAAGTPAAGTPAAGTPAVETPAAAPAVMPPAGPPEVGKPLVIEGTLVNGSAFDWSAYQGKVVLVDFWATWCPPCVAEMPSVKRTYEMFHSKGFEIVGVSLDEDKAALEKYIADNQIPWQNLFGANQQQSGWQHPMAVHYGIKSIPAPVLLNAQGNVVSVSARGEVLGQLLTELLGAAEVSSVGQLANINKTLDQFRTRPEQPIVGMRRVPGFEGAIEHFNYGWMTELLPYLGQEQNYRKIDFTKTWAEEVNDEIGRVEIPAFLNPGDGRTRWEGFPPHFLGMAMSHFVGMSGVEDKRNDVAAAFPRDDARAGVFGYDAIAKLDEITDGTSQTIAVLGAGELISPWIQGGGSTIRGAREPYFNDITGFNSKGLPTPGVQVLMADGSVKTVSKDIDPKVFRAMCTIRGADSVDLSTLTSVTAAE